MEPLQHDPNFWTTVMSLRDPAYRQPTDDELIQLEADVSDAAHELARMISTRETAYRLAGQEVPDGVVMAPDWGLSFLYSLRQIEDTVRRLAERTARTVGATGCSYTHLGAAWGITRQAARLRWPDAVRKPGAQEESLELRIAGGFAELQPLPDGSGFTWEAAAADGSTGRGETPYPSKAEAAANAGAFLALHSLPADRSHR
ncbi:hypothetical protein ACWGHA_26470 [Streptomyces xanthophaeus]